MLQAYEGLPDSHRQALALSRTGMSAGAIAAQSGVPVERVRTWVLHAVLALTQARLAADAPAPRAAPSHSGLAH